MKMRDKFCQITLLRVYVTVLVFRPTRYLKLRDKFVTQICLVLINLTIAYRLSSIVYRLGFSTYMLFAGWEVRTVKNCDRGLESEVTAFHYMDRP